MQRDVLCQIIQVNLIIMGITYVLTHLLHGEESFLRELQLFS